MSNDNYSPDDVIVEIGSPSGLNMEAGSRGGSVAAVGAKLGARGGAAELGRRLLLAARAGDSRLVLALMAHGAPFACDWLGTSALHLAAGAGHAHTCGVLLRAGVSRDSRTKVERTPLHVAAAAGHAHVVQLLLQHGAAVDCRDMLGMTALHWAAARGHVACARALLAAGASPRARSRFLHSPADLAARAQHRELQLHILEYQNQETQEPKVIFDTEQSSPAATRAAPAPPAAAAPRDLPALDAEVSDPHTNTLLHALTNNGIINAENVSQQRERSRAPPAAPAAPAPPSPPPPTVLGAVASGRSLVLSDAGKIMLKESEPRAAAPPPAGPAPAGPAPAAAGVRLVSIGNKLFSLAPAEQLEKQVTNVKFLQIPGEKISSIKYPLKAKQRVVRPAPRAPAAAPAPLVAFTAPARPTVRFIMNKANFSELLALNNNAIPIQIPVRTVEPVVTSAGGVATEAAETGGAAAGEEAEAARLRRELAAARATIASLSAQLQQRQQQ